MTDYHSIAVRVRRLHGIAQMPRYQTDGAGCFDLHCVSGGSVIHSREFDTGLAFEVPAGHVMLIFSRSGHGFKHDARLANCVGVIDSDYRGEVKVKLTADGDPFDVADGERIAQAMIIRAPTVLLQEAEELSATARAAGGFGSTNDRPPAPPPRNLPLSERRQAYEDEYRGIAADMTYAEWCLKWSMQKTRPQIAAALSRQQAQSQTTDF